MRGFYSFVGLPAGQQPPAWAKHHTLAGAANWLVEAGATLKASSASGGHVGRSALYNGDASSAAGETVEVAGLSAATSTWLAGQVFARGSAAAHFGYELSSSAPSAGVPARARLRYRFATSSVSSLAAEVSLPFVIASGALYGFRLRVEDVVGGVRVRGKVWVWDAAVPARGEPAAWSIDTGVIATPGGAQASGHAGLGSEVSPPTLPGERYHFLGFATGEFSAPLAPLPSFVSLGGVAIPVRVGTWREVRGDVGSVVRGSDGTASSGVTARTQAWEGETPRLSIERYAAVRAALSAPPPLEAAGVGVGGGPWSCSTRVLGATVHPGGRRSVRFRIQRRA